MLELGTPTGGYKFSEVEIFARSSQGKDDLKVSVGPVERSKGYKHLDRLRRLTCDIAAECAVDRTDLLIEEVKDDELSPEGHRLTQGFYRCRIQR